MSLMGKKLDRRKLSTLLTVLMIMFMMVSSVFTSKLIIAEDEGTDTDTDINLPIDDPQEAFLLKEHLNGESFVEVSENRILLSDVSEENKEFDGAEDFNEEEDNEEEGEFGFCDFCGDETFNGTKLDSGSFVCERCLENCCEKCEECGKTFLSEAMETYNGKRLCFICAGNLKSN